MALSGYGVLVARVLEGRSEPGSDTPHHQIRASGRGVEFRVAVDALSSGPRRSCCSWPTKPPSIRFCSRCRAFPTG
jgi:hypothetical protein